MKQWKTALGYGLAAGFVFILDQLTKSWAIKFAKKTYHLTSFLSFKSCLNRGISWGILNSKSTFVFGIVTLLVMAVIAFLFWYMVTRLNEGKGVFVETLVLSGAISNVVDRFAYGGVVDFIIISFNGWSWPAFNIADGVIVCGVLVMMIFSFKE